MTKHYGLFNPLEYRRLSFLVDGLKTTDSIQLCDCESQIAVLLSEERDLTICVCCWLTWCTVITEMCQQIDATLMLMRSTCTVQHGGRLNKKQTSVCVCVCSVSCILQRGGVTHHNAFHSPINT